MMAPGVRRVRCPHRDDIRRGRVTRPVVVHEIAPILRRGALSHNVCGMLCDGTVLGYNKSRRLSRSIVYLHTDFLRIVGSSHGPILSDRSHAAVSDNALILAAVFHGVHISSL